MTSGFESIEKAKTIAQYEALGLECSVLIDKFATNKHRDALVYAIFSELLNRSPYSHDLFETVFTEVLNSKQEAEKAEALAKEGRKTGLGKYNERVDVALLKDDDEEETGAGTGVGAEIVDEATLAKRAAEEEEALKEEIKRNREIKRQQELADERKRENERLLAEKARKVDADEVAKKLADQGFVFVMPDDGKKKGKKK